MNLKLNVQKGENGRISAGLIKKMCELNCRINIDLADGIILINGIDDDKIEDVIANVAETFEIIGVEIIPEEVVTEVSVEEKDEVSTPEKEEDEPTADSYEVKKIQFENEEIENRIENLLKTIAWAISVKNANENDMVKYILSAISEIHLKYATEKHMDFSVGDIVDTNFGSRAKCEISGGHVHALVCNIDQNGSICVVPIAKGVYDYDETIHMSFSTPKDAEYNDSRFSGGVLLLNKAIKIFQGRINSIVGHAKPELFDKVLEDLPKMFDFRKKNENYEEQLNIRLGNVDNEDDTFETQEEENTSEETIPENAEETSTEDSKPDKKPTTTKYLQQRFPKAFKAIASQKNEYQKICVFWKKIDFKCDDSYILGLAFEAALVCEPKYGIIVNYIKEKMNADPRNSLTEGFIRKVLKKDFKAWIEKYPDIKEKYPHINLMHLLTAFSKKVKKPKN